MAAIIHTMVAQTIRISSDASVRFRRPNSIGVKSRFVTRLIAKGTAMSQGSWPRQTWMKTKPNVTAMTGYKMRQIRPMVAGAGVQAGLASELYQSSQSMELVRVARTNAVASIGFQPFFDATTITPAWNSL